MSAFATKDAEPAPDAKAVEPTAEATSSGSPAMTPLSTEELPAPETEEPIAELPEEATDTRFDEKEIKSVLVTGATGGVGKCVSSLFYQCCITV